MLRAIAADYRYLAKIVYLLYIRILILKLLYSTHSDSVSLLMTSLEQRHWTLGKIRDIGHHIKYHVPKRKYRMQSLLRKARLAGPVCTVIKTKTRPGIEATRVAIDCVARRTKLLLEWLSTISPPRLLATWTATLCFLCWSFLLRERLVSDLLFTGLLGLIWY